VSDRRLDVEAIGVKKLGELDRCIEGLQKSMPGVDWSAKVSLDIKRIVASHDTRAILLAAPMEDEMELFERFVRDILAKCGINTIVLGVGYGFEFKCHPEVVEQPALSHENAKRIASVCRDNGMRLVPQMNLFGHQSSGPDKQPRGIIRAYPDMEEIHDGEIVYQRCLCLTHPELRPLVYSLIDEMIDVFGTSDFHIGQDEGFEIGKCERCKGLRVEDIYADWVNALHGHLAARGVATWMWGDRLLNGHIIPERGAGYETSLCGTWKAIDMIPRDIMICDWHYRVLPYGHHSPAYWARHGFRFVVCPYNNMFAADQLIVAAVAADTPLFSGVFHTTWSRFRTFAEACFDLYPKYLSTHELDGDSLAGNEAPRGYKDACTFMHLFAE
jgi:hypothetical protein